MAQIKPNAEEVLLRILNNPKFDKLVQRVVRAGLPTGTEPLFSLRTTEMVTKTKFQKTKEKLNAEVQKMGGGEAAKAKVDEENIRQQALHTLASQGGAVFLLQRYRMLDRQTKMASPDTARQLGLINHWQVLNRDIEEYLMAFEQAFPQQDDAMNYCSDRLTGQL